jgi:hypothetical protein
MERTRQQNYFKNLPDLEPPFAQAVDFIKQQPDAADSIGLMLDFNDYEYPIWVLLKNDFQQRPNIYHVQVKNVSAGLAGDRPMPDLIFSTTDEIPDGEIKYEKIWESSTVKILRKK